MKHDFVIIGGGVAGLSAAIRLTEWGIHPLVIESGTYPAHKVCGEFLSPPAVDRLQAWDIQTIPLHQARFHNGSQKVEFKFPTPSGSLSHLQLDPMLAIRAKSGGATIFTDAKVEMLSPEKVVLTNGTVIEPKNLLIAAGRVHGSPKFLYKGFKAHYEGLNVDCLEMHLIDGGYMGISPIENGKFNVACLTTGKEPPPLTVGKSLFKEWMSVPVPRFGIKKTPLWKSTYFIGDAAGSIPPITGNGLTLAILSGIMGADFAVRNDVDGFRAAWHQRFKNPIFWGKIAHEITLRPFIGKPLISMIPYFYKKTQII